MNRSAFVTGTTGQDGSYLSDLLLSKGYRKIYALVRFSSTPITSTNMKHLLNNPKVEIVLGDIADATSILRGINTMVRDHPDAERYEIYSLAAQSHVGVSFNCPSATIDANVRSVVNILDAVLFLGIKENTRIYQASTSEMYGQVEEVPQSETTPFHPRSPYGVSKLCAHWLIKNYRETHNLFACCGILFNHESPRRGANFVTQKIVLNATSDASILELGNLSAQRDWGHAEDYVEAMWLMLQQDEPEEYVVASGTMTTVREFCTIVFAKVGVTLRWEGEGENEVGMDGDVVRIRVNKKYYRPCEVEELKGDPTKIKGIGWTPRHDLNSLVDDMIQVANYKAKYLVG